MEHMRPHVLVPLQKKVTPFMCLTEGCSGYVQQATLLEGPRGEVFKHKQYEIPPELEEQMQAAREKKHEEMAARCSKRKPTKVEPVCVFACGGGMGWRVWVWGCGCVLSMEGGI